MYLKLLQKNSSKDAIQKKIYSKDKLAKNSKKSKESRNTFLGLYSEEGNKPETFLNRGCTIHLNLKRRKHVLQRISHNKVEEINQSIKW